ncbi:MAG: cytochrome C oxidase subunit IV family protein [Candidatus Binataceae bacterium]
MSDHVIEHEPMMTHEITGSHHPGPLVYIVVAIALTTLTGFEIGVFYAPFLQAVLVPLLIILAICKFVLVAMFYMHLHYDSRVFSAVFLFPLWVALLIVISLMLIFFYLSGRIFLTSGWTF